MIIEFELRFRGFFYLSSDIVVVGNKITFRNASFRLLNSFLLAIQFKPISLPSMTNAVVPSCESLVYSLRDDISLVSN